MSTCFQLDEYVRESYLIANAVRSMAHKYLNTEGIDPDGIEEQSIVLITRPTKPPTRKEKRETITFLQALVDQGMVGAWYTLESGDVAEVLFCRSTDTKVLEDLFAKTPAVKATKASALVWPQWLSKGVVK